MVCVHLCVRWVMYVSPEMSVGDCSFIVLVKSAVNYGTCYHGR